MVYALVYASDTSRFSESSGDTAWIDTQERIGDRRKQVRLPRAIPPTQKQPSLRVSGEGPRTSIDGARLRRGLKRLEGQPLHLLGEIRRVERLCGQALLVRRTLTTARLQVRILSGEPIFTRYHLPAQVVKPLDAWVFRCPRLTLASRKLPRFSVRL